MANPVNIFDFAGETLATFLATPVSDGTYADVFGTEKVDNQPAAATQVFEYAGELLSNGVDDFIQAAYPYIRQVALGGSGEANTASNVGAGQGAFKQKTGVDLEFYSFISPDSSVLIGLSTDDITLAVDWALAPRLRETPSPAFGGVPGAFTYTISPDERINFNDSGPPVGGDILTLTAPDVTALTAAQEGAEFSFRLQQGNPISAVAVIVPAANVIVDPQTGADAGPPGTGLFFLPGTLGAGAIFTWKGVGGAQDRWVLQAEANVSSGGGATGWPSELAVDRTTSSNNPQITDGDEVQFGTSSPKVKAPADQSRDVSFASGGLSALVNVGAYLYQHSAISSIAGRVTVRATGQARISGGSIATTDLYPFTLEQEWELSSGGDSIIATHHMDGSGVGQISFGVDVTGPLREIYLKVNEGANIGRTVDVFAKITTSVSEQEIA